ncbi:hypothetical protein Scep_022284 [Stephania cephalantha]|uniref:Uncharacterized protein n=1 Tax=Stephania cephalantha TaxID=152367 RepID=A0AAP0F7N4_9MAGN
MRKSTSPLQSRNEELVGRKGIVRQRAIAPPFPVVHHHRCDAASPPLRLVGACVVVPARCCWRRCAPLVHRASLPSHSRPPSAVRDSFSRVAHCRGLPPAPATRSVQSVKAAKPTAAVAPLLRITCPRRDADVAATAAPLLHRPSLAAVRCLLSRLLLLSAGLRFLLPDQGATVMIPP